MDEEEISKFWEKKKANCSCDFYQITEEGNFEGRNILNTPQALEEFQRSGEWILEVESLFFAAPDIMESAGKTHTSF